MKDGQVLRSLNVVVAFNFSTRELVNFVRLTQSNISWEGEGGGGWMGGWVGGSLKQRSSVLSSVLRVGSVLTDGVEERERERERDRDRDR